MQHRLEAEIEQSGTLTLRGLPFREGEKVIVVVTTHAADRVLGNCYPLRGLAVEYKNPFDSVAETDWSAVQ